MPPLLLLVWVTYQKNDLKNRRYLNNKNFIIIETKTTTILAQTHFSSKNSYSAFASPGQVVVFVSPFSIIFFFWRQGSFCRYNIFYQKNKPCTFYFLYLHRLLELKLSSCSLSTKRMIWFVKNKELYLNYFKDKNVQLSYSSMEWVNNI